MAACVSSPAAIAEQSSTFHRDIAPIIAAQCSECHRPNGVAPFSLQSFEDVRKRGRQIVEVTQSGFMPPWLPEHNAQPPFIGERRLSEAQKVALREWVEGGMKEGEAAAAKMKEFPQTVSDWPLGKPDLTLQISQPFTLAAQTNDTIRTFVLPIDLDRKRFIQAIDFRTNAPRAVHHASFLIDTTGTARVLDEGDPQPGYPAMGDIGLNLAGSVGAWSPASALVRHPKDAGFLLPPKSDLVVEVHFNPTGKEEIITPEVAIYLSTDDVERQIVSVSLGTFAIDIPPEEKSYLVKDVVTVPVDARLLGLTPHAHYLCKSIDVTATSPEGEKRTLLKINDWDFNWQQEYRYAESLHLPAGTRIEMQFVYDNSSTNPRNPSVPPKHVRSGATAADEMGLLFLHVVAANEEERLLLERANHDQLMKRMRGAQEQKRKNE